MSGAVQTAARYSMPTGRFAPFLILAFGTLAGALSSSRPVVVQEKSERPDLSGRVRRADGSALAAATVYIYTATPRRGTSPY